MITYLLYASMYVSFQLISITFTQTLHMYIPVYEIFQLNNTLPQFVITTAALKCSGTVCCYQKHLLLCTGMLVIARQNEQI
jgi:hypothetical protein